MKRYVAAALSSLFLMSCISCETPEKSDPADTIHVDVFSTVAQEDDAFITWLLRCAEEWKNEDYQIEIDTVFNSRQDRQLVHQNMLYFEFTSPDLVLLTPIEFSYYIDYDIIQPLNEYAERNENWNADIFIDTLLENSSLGGKLYGVPVLAETRGLWYRKDVLAQAGLPEEPEINTWDEFLDILVTVKERCPEVVPFFHYETIIETLVFNTGGEFISDNKWVSQSTPYREAFNFAEQLAQNQLLSAGGVTPSLDDQQESLDLFREGKIAFYMDYQFLRGWYENHLYDPWENFTEEVGFLPFPTIDGSRPYGQNGMRQFMIPKYSHYPEEAFDFIQYCMSSESYGEMVVQTSYLPTTKSEAELSYYTDDPIRRVQVDLLSNTKNLMRTDSFDFPHYGMKNLVRSIEDRKVTAENAYNSYPAIAADHFSASNLIVLP
ncbi:MAG: ABC transporter substrate-binding protein [Massiliimalia sp.]|jgi:multiple sugar transport system substrate-binding protein